MFIVLTYIFDKIFSVFVLFIISSTNGIRFLNELNTFLYNFCLIKLKKNSIALNWLKYGTIVKILSFYLNKILLIL